jgi:ribosomal protein L1
MSKTTSSSQTSSESERKKRKWDVVASPLNSTNVDPEQAAQLAQEAAKKINEQLTHQLSSPIQIFEKEIEINQYRPEVRYLICKATTHEEIMKETGANIKIRGKYKLPGDTSSERALHLYISGNTKESVDAASEKLENILKAHESSKTSTSGAVNFQAKVVVGMEGADPSFNVVGKILGPKGQYVRHIAVTTNTKVILKGVGSGFLEGLEQKASSYIYYWFIKTTGRTSKIIM